MSKAKEFKKLEAQNKLKTGFFKCTHKDTKVSIFTNNTNVLDAYEDQGFTIAECTEEEYKASKGIKK